MTLVVVVVVLPGVGELGDNLGKDRFLETFLEVIVNGLDFGGD